MSPRKIYVKTAVVSLIPMKFFQRTLQWETVRNMDAFVGCTKR